MIRWILAAEADKIQDLVFRSAHLREVVGGSQLLTRFCREGTPQLLAYQRGLSVQAVQIERTCDEITQQLLTSPTDQLAGAAPTDILVADGGSFSILFDTEDDACNFGRMLAQLYWKVTGSTLTVAAPVQWSGKPKDFKAANKHARQELTQAKREGRDAIAVAHLPYAAFCASCGVALARTHEQLHELEQANYLCASCRTKADERDNEGIGFLFDFKEAVVGKAAGKCRCPSEADELAQGWDPRNYVAYLIADGNSMGDVFDECSSPGILHYLSESLTCVLRASLAQPTRQLMDRAHESKRRRVPALPLILGGDDVFVLLPAPYALDFARRFCLEYERRMGVVLEALGLKKIRPTMAAAVVICKSKYPHTLVHRHGQALLKEAKRLSKAVAAMSSDSPALSIVHFDVILGSRIAKVAGQARAEFRASLRPYWVMGDENGDEKKREAREEELLSLQVGLPLSWLIEERCQLRTLPARRMAQLRTLYAPNQLPTKKDASLGRWQARLEQMISRVARSQKQADRLRATLARLGGQELGYWYYANRPDPEQVTFLGHGLPDLLEVWDFSLNLDKDRSQYEEQEG